MFELGTVYGGVTPDENEFSTRENIKKTQKASSNWGKIILFTADGRKQIQRLNNFNNFTVAAGFVLKT